MLGANIKYLRNKFKFSQQDLADKLGVPRSSLSDYERGHTQVSIENLIKLSDIFDVKIDNLLRSNLSHRDLEILRNKDLRVLAISVDAENNSNIELVDTKAEAGYLESYADPEYIKVLPKIAFPNIPQGTYRGFEIHGDSMLPMESGTIVVCAYVEHLRDIKKDRTYVVISKSEGVVYKRVRPDFTTQKLVLISDNDNYLPYELPFNEIDEIWQYYAHLSFSDVKYRFNNMLEEKLQDIQKKLTEVHQVITK
ncbi:MAG TPA: helix-turn-helix domain-containing protein [Saprospiraceae bacterium]|jgi:transcriptional regulator with XRE-family HTH domain|nr:helix-turn-helix domain-containing protein [Saprospiraceae bacterium]HMT70537.1 helix-turn-helix domain-containing protein [Saprospiraceae bacterium]